jgi:flagellar hook-basal body complex protein FliE
MSNAISGLRILPADIVPAKPKSAGNEGNFVDTLRDAMDGVLLDGNGVDVHAAMIAVEKADLSFQLMMQVRNKIVQAYQDISRLQF